MGTDALPPTDPRSLPTDVKRKLLAARDALTEGDAMEAYHQIYSIAAPHFDKLADEVWTGLESPEPVREMVPACCYNGPCDYKSPPVPDNPSIGPFSPEPAPATTDRVAPSFDAWWNDDAYGCLRYSDPVQFDRLRQAFNAGVAAARAAPEPDGMQVALDRACHTIMELMQAYERRIRSDCTTPEQLAAKPWECAEYIRGARYLKAVFKDGRAQPFAALDEFLGYLRSSETKDGHHG